MMMTQKRLLVLFILTFLLTIVFILMKSRTTVDLILTNGVVYTVDGSDNVAGAVAIHGNHIAGVGSSEDIARRFTSETVLDLHGMAVYPGFIDAHTHVVATGTAMMTLDLSRTGSPEEITGLVQKKIDEQGKERWVRGRGWDQNLWVSKKFPNAGLLDKVAPETPVVLSRVDGHAFWVNSTVLHRAGITAETPDPEGGKIIRDGRNNPTGVLLDNAMLLVEKVMPVVSDAEIREAITKTVHRYLTLGVTEVHDMGVSSQILGVYRQLIDEGNFPFRVYAYLDCPGDTWDEYRTRGPIENYGDYKLVVRGIKLYMDGALGSRGAALIEPYTDDPGNRGYTVAPDDTLRSLMSDAARRGFQVASHAIGDRANNIALHLYEQVLTALPDGGRDKRFRIEHAQVIDPADIPRFSKLGVIPSMQPIHCTSDMYWAESRLGVRRSEGAYAWHSLIETGCIIPAGSDSPVEDPNPLLGFYAAVTRKDTAGHPKNYSDALHYFQTAAGETGDTNRFVNGWFAGQAMTREQALRAYTLWGATAAFQERIKGSVEKGKLADLVVLTKDVMKIPDAEIPSTEVYMTIIDGKPVYAKIGAQ